MSDKQIDLPMPRRVGAVVKSSTELLGIANKNRQIEPGSRWVAMDGTSAITILWEVLSGGKERTFIAQPTMGGLKKVLGLGGLLEQYREEPS